MTTKKAILLTIVLGFVALVVGLGLMVTLIDINSSGAERKAAALGQIVGIVTVIPIAVVWITWGLQMRKQNKANVLKRKSLG